MGRCKMHFFRNRRLVFTLSLFLLLSYSYAQGGDSQKGKALFNSNCAACHKLDKKMVGPALQGISSRKDKEWLYKWIRNSSALIKSGDSDAIAIFEEFNSLPMTAYPQLTNENIDDILAYTLSPPKKKKKETVGADKESSTDEGEGGSLLMLLLSILFAMFSVLFVVVNRKLKQIDRLIKKPHQDGDESKGKSIFRVYMENDFLVFVTVVISFLISMYFTYGYLMQVGVDQGYRPIQPIHFSHKVHAGDNKIDCKYCHSSSRVSRHSGVPALNVCMNCHKSISEYNGEEDVEKGYDKMFYDGEIQKLYKAVGWDVENGAYTGKASPVKWVRIHNLPNFVYFNHSQHVSVAGIDCKKCHGQVQEMDVVHQHAPLTMGWCVDCHRNTNVKVRNNEYYDKIHKELLARYGVDKFTEAQMGGLECGKCHY